MKNNMNTTCAIIKPDAVMAGHAGNIISIIELNKFTITHMHKVRMTHQQAEMFYAVHRERSFFKELVEYMVSGYIIVMALEKRKCCSRMAHADGCNKSSTSYRGNHS